MEAHWGEGRGTQHEAPSQGDAGLDIGVWSDHAGLQSELHRIQRVHEHSNQWASVKNGEDAAQVRRNVQDSLDRVLRRMRRVAEMLESELSA